MLDFQPLVSIVIPIYNGANYMREAIDSALAQTYSNIEVIVVNDGSTDNSEEIALSYGNRIRYFKKENGGVSSALNLGIKEMQGKYFSWLSHDDVYYPDKIATQVKAIEHFSDKKCIVICDSEFIDKDSKPLSKKSKLFINSNKVIISWKEGLHGLLLHGSFNGCSLLIPKVAFEQCGVFDEKLRFNQDGFMWIKLLLCGYSILYTPKVCVKSRIHKCQVTQQRQDLFHMDCDLMSDYLIPKLIQITTQDDRFLFEYAKYNGKSNNMDVVRKIFQEATCQQLSFKERVVVRIISKYGKVRPFIRRFYYLIFRKIKTE